MLSIAKKKMQVSKGVGGLGDAASMMLLLKSKKAEAEKEQEQDQAPAAEATAEKDQNIDEMIAELEKEDKQKRMLNKNKGFKETPRKSVINEVEDDDDDGVSVDLDA